MIRRLGDFTPQVAPTAYVDESAQVIGNVTLDEHASIWPGAVLRGDMHYIRIGAYTNIQDLCLVHVEEGTMPAVLEDHITVGHGVIVHACHVERRCLVGMGSIILSGARIGSGSIVAAGTVVPEGTVIPPRSLVMGVPGKVRREVTDAELKRIDDGVQAYFQWKERYLADLRANAAPVGRR